MLGFCFRCWGGGGLNSGELKTNLSNLYIFYSFCLILLVPSSSPLVHQACSILSVVNLAADKHQWHPFYHKFASLAKFLRVVFECKNGWMTQSFIIWQKKRKKGFKILWFILFFMCILFSFLHFVFHYQCTMYHSKLLQMFICLIFGECVCDMMCVRGRDDYFILKQKYSG